MEKLIQLTHAFAAVLALSAGALASEAQQTSPARVPSSYVLGPDDLISIRVLQAPELFEKPVRIDLNGFLDLPYAGRIRAAGTTVEVLKTELELRYTAIVREPHVSVTIEEFRSQPVSVIGAVTTPGTHQIRGKKTLVEVLSLAGGLRQDAGNTVKITRRLEWGPIPLDNASDDPSGKFSVAAVNLRELMEAKNPGVNVLVQPDDVISVPRADMVYVIGDVPRAGGFVLNERESMSLLEALSLAGGLNRTAAGQSCKILRSAAGSTARTEIPVDVKKILAGRGKDMQLQPDDILFVPDSSAKRASLRALEAAIQMGTGVAIWRR